MLFYGAYTFLIVLFDKEVTTIPECIHLHLTTSVPAK